MEEHLHHLNLLFQRLQSAGLVINREKCLFGVKEVEFLGHHVSAFGTTPIASRVAAIAYHPRDSERASGFLRGHKLLPPLCRQMSESWNPSRTSYKAAPALQRQFHGWQWCSQRLTSLRRPWPTACLWFILLLVQKSPFWWTCSQSILELPFSKDRIMEAPWHPLGIFSWKLDKAQVGYSAFDPQAASVRVQPMSFPAHVRGQEICNFHWPKALHICLVPGIRNLVP